MRINNKRIIPWIETIYALLFLALLPAIILLFIPIGVVVEFVSPYLIIGTLLVLLFLLYKSGNQHFEYDSDGEVIHICSQDAFWSKYFSSKKTTMDFPKTKLISYRVKESFLQKTLELIVSSKRNSNGVVKLKFNITYLNASEISDMKRSLSKIIKNNTKNKTEEAAKQ